MGSHLNPGSFTEYTGHLIWAVNPLNTELNPICHLLALVGAHHILHVSRVKVKGSVVYIFIALCFGTVGLLGLTF